jgi:hypothetical protein
LRRMSTWAPRRAPAAAADADADADADAVSSFAYVAMWLSFRSI